MTKFQIGDKVRVVNYGHKIWYSSQETKENFEKWNDHINNKVIDYLMWGSDYKHTPEPIFNKVNKSAPCESDISSELVGKEGIIDGISSDSYTYSIQGIPGKHAWYDEDQLELVK